MRMKVDGRFIFLCILILLWAAIPAFFLFKISGRAILPDFLRPFFSFLLLAVSVRMFLSSRNYFSRVAGGVLALAGTLIGLFTAFAFRYFRQQRRALSDGDLYATLQSDTAETYSYVVENFFTPKALLIALCFLLLSAVLFVSIGLIKGELKLSNSKRVLALAICLTGSFVLFTQLHPVKTLVKAHKQFVSDIAEFNRLAATLEQGSSAKVVKTEKGELYVIVIGESEGRDFMHTYGGPYSNTPWQDSIRKDAAWIFFQNTYSNHTHTVPALTAAFGEGRELTGRIFPKGLNIMSVSRKADIKTYWLSNQNAFGPWDNPVSALANQADTTDFTRPYSQSFDLSGPKPDGCILPLFEQTLEGLDFSRNNLVIIHLMGTHAPYEARYPEGFPEPDIFSRGLIGKAADDTALAAKYSQYLASISYTDHVLEEIFSRVSRYGDSPAFMLYFADHAEDLFSRDGGHNFSNFTWIMARSPAMVWLSDKYRSRYPETARQLVENSDRIFTNDLIYDLYLGLANIKVEDATRTFDISSPEYSLTPQIAVISGQKKILDDPLWIAARNIENLQGRIAMHRANSVFKAAQGQKLGLNSLEVDLMLKQSGESDGHLVVGHDDETSTGMFIDDYLDRLDGSPDFIWLDIKNLTVDNSGLAMQILEDLNRKHGIKNIALIESSKPQALTAFSEAGWETSYYLPWKTLLESAKKNDAEIFKKVAASVKDNDIRAVSYDLEADGVVRTQLLPLLPSGTVLYSWDTGLNLSDPELAKKLEGLEHLKRLLVTFSSPYSI